MKIHENRFATIAWACAVILAVRTANAAQRTAGMPVTAPTTLGWSSSFSSTYTKESERRPPPTLLPGPDPTTGVAEEPGAGNAYGTRGVLELGGFANFSGASTFTSIQLSPMAGLFVFDRIELSAIVGFNYVHQTIDPGTPAERGENRTILRILGEPSYHLPLSRTVWGFLGVGLGVASVPRATGGTGAGFDVAPRAGANILVGSSGILTPAAFLDHTTGGSFQTSNGNLLRVSTTYGVQAGYTVIR